ncbi:MAG: hypothetical protein HY023_01835 [Chloroflexi bacterium]|nr:hypothetical protein [Chloroflexota bacterium]
MITTSPARTQGDSVATAQAPVTREAALALAERCATLLKERFGATRVIPFGSVVGDGLWRADSDLDLAVEGLPPGQFFSACGEAQRLLPGSLELHLVDMKTASPQLRARILGEVKMADDPVAQLKSIVEDELEVLSEISERMNEALTTRADPPTWKDLAVIGSVLHRFYTGVENILERILDRLGEQKPTGGSWHIELLDQVTEPAEGIRAPVIDRALRQRLERYLRFRHFFRRAYDKDLEWPQMKPEATDMAATLAELRSQLTMFFDRL